MTNVKYQMTKNIKHKTKRKNIKDVKLLILDVDGVMTDGSIIYDDKGNEYKIFNIHDGHGIKLARNSGIKAAVVSGRKSSIIDKRAQELGIEDVYQGVDDKSAALRELLIKYKIDSSEVCAVGDDVLDLGLMKKVGFPVAVNNARPEVKRIAKYITALDGGNGAVREIVEMILKRHSRK